MMKHSNLNHFWKDKKNKTNFHLNKVFHNTFEIRKQKILDVKARDNLTLNKIILTKIMVTKISTKHNKKKKLKN